MEIVLQQPDGTRRIVKVKHFPTMKLRVPYHDAVHGGFGEINYEYKGHTDDDGRPIYE